MWRALSPPDGLGLDAWRQPRGKRAVETVIDRLMNPDVLANLGDGIASSAVVKKVEVKEAKECVLADLQGPGAVVRIADQQRRPPGLLLRRRRAAAHPVQARRLVEGAPELTGTNNPVLTCLTFRERLRVVLRDAKPGEYRLDYLRFPADCRLASFDKAGEGVPPRWIEAVVYRCSQAGWGTTASTTRCRGPNRPRRNSPRERPSCSCGSMARAWSAGSSCARRRRCWRTMTCGWK